MEIEFAGRQHPPRPPTTNHLTHTHTRCHHFQSIRLNNRIHTHTQALAVDVVLVLAHDKLYADLTSALRGQDVTIVKLPR